jgi:Flp pilus assembly protein TadG
MAIKTLFSGLRDCAVAFRKARDGNIAIIFALSAFPVIGLVGLSIDYSRANSIKADMQSALDAAALMLSKSAATISSDQLQTNANAYFTALFNHPETTLQPVTATYTTTGGSQVTVSGTGTVQPRFMGLIPGLQGPLTISTDSTVKWGISKLRVALALDNTGSMADAGKITALKTATKSLLAQLKAAAQTNGDVYVSIIPFSKDVNVGKTNYGASWIDWTEWDAANGANATTFSGSVCISGTLYRVSGSSWVTGGNCTGTGSGICYQGTLWKWNGSSFYTSGACSSGTNHVNWNGCITDRGNVAAPSPQNYDQNVLPPLSTDAGSRYPAEQYSDCPLQMMGLNYDWTAMNTLVDQMYPAGYTNQPIGLVWGWLSLVGGGPLTAPAKTSTDIYNDVIILLSDGLNTEDRWYVTPLSIDNRMYNATGAGTCANIKAAGITIYTIQVNTGGDPTSTLMKNCASDPSKFFLLTSANQMVSTFNTIGTNLAQLRLAK